MEVVKCFRFAFQLFHKVLHYVRFTLNRSVSAVFCSFNVMWIRFDSLEEKKKKKITVAHQAYAKRREGTDETECG